jgi:hypothetical protein
MTLEQVTVFLAWNALIQIAILSLATVVVIAARDRITALHARLFDVDPDALRWLYVQYLGIYKIVILVFVVVPYLVLRCVFGV